MPRRWRARCPGWGTALALGLSAALVVGSVGWAEEAIVTDEEALFGGGGAVVEAEPAPTGGSAGPGEASAGQGTLADALLGSGETEVGGTAGLSVQSEWGWLDQAPPGSAASQSLKVDLKGRFFLDIRPSTDFRVFAKTRSSTAGTGGEAKLSLTELFADFDVADQVFVRAGKQTVNWGVGYFFSPADIVNVGRIDPENPLAEREGPVAVKLHRPAGSNNYYVYLLFPEPSLPTDSWQLALAPKAEVVWGGSEWGLGAFYQAQRAPRAMVTLSTSLGRLSLFGEGVLSYGADRRFLEERPVSGEYPWGLAVVRRDQTYFGKLTAGARYLHNDAEQRFQLSGALQYYFNGEGYAGAFLREHAAGVAALLHSGAIGPADLRESGRHYLALSLAWAKALGSRLSPGLYWLGNLSDGSGKVALSLGLEAWDYLRPSVSLSRTYGLPGSELAPAGGRTAVTVALWLVNGWWPAGSLVAGGAVTALFHGAWRGQGAGEGAAPALSLKHLQGSGSR